MAKLGKIKFNALGHYLGNTTGKGEVELTLHYDWLNEYFHFDTLEVRKFFPNTESNEWSYRYCRTKQQAISVMRGFMKDYTETKRMMSIHIGVPDKLRKSKKVSAQLAMMLEQGSMYKTNGISISYERVLRIGNDPESYSYVVAIPLWTPQENWLHKRGENMIEWTEEMEQFIIMMQKKMDDMCGMVMDFFNTETPEALLDKMKNSQLRLGGE